MILSAVPGPALTPPAIDGNLSWLLSVSIGTKVIDPNRFLPLITGRIGDGWIQQLNQLRGLGNLAEQREFQQEWQPVKRDNKLRVAGFIRQRTGVLTDPDSLFDILVKRIHEYKRPQLTRFCDIFGDPRTVGAQCIGKVLHQGGKEPLARFRGGPL